MRRILRIIPGVDRWHQELRCWTAHVALVEVGRGNLFSLGELFSFDTGVGVRGVDKNNDALGGCGGDYSGRRNHYRRPAPSGRTTDARAAESVTREPSLRCRRPQRQRLAKRMMMALRSRRRRRPAAASKTAGLSPQGMAASKGRCGEMSAILTSGKASSTARVE